MSSLSLPIAAFFAGLISFLSPCVLPLVPGVVIILFGLHLTGIFKLKALYTDARLHSVKGSSTPIGAFVIGFAFAFGWTPCLGPILSAILTIAGEQDTVG